MSIRELTAHRASVLNEHVRVFVLDAPGNGGACHDYVTLIPHAWTDSHDDMCGNPGAHGIAQHPLADGSILWLTAHGVAAIVKGTGPAREHGEAYIAQRIRFQNGPLKDAGGANGTSHEALLAIILDRLEGFQRGDFKCRDNAVAATHIETGLLWLKKRTWDRIARGVEGTLKP